MIEGRESRQYRRCYQASHSYGQLEISPTVGVWAPVWNILSIGSSEGWGAWVCLYSCQSLIMGCPGGMISRHFQDATLAAATEHPQAGKCSFLQWEVWHSAAEVVRQRDMCRALAALATTLLWCNLGLGSIKSWQLGCQAGHAHTGQIFGSVGDYVPWQEPWALPCQLPFIHLHIFL